MKIDLPNIAKKFPNLLDNGIVAIILKLCLKQLQLLLFSVTYSCGQFSIRLQSKLSE